MGGAIPQKYIFFNFEISKFFNSKIFVLPFLGSGVIFESFVS